MSLPLAPHRLLVISQKCVRDFAVSELQPLCRTYALALNFIYVHVNCVQPCAFEKQPHQY